MSARFAHINPAKERANLQQWIAAKEHAAQDRKAAFNRAAEEVWRACGGLGVERKSDAEIAELLAIQRSLMA